MAKFELPSSLVVAQSKTGRWCAASGRKIALADFHGRKKVAAKFVLPNTSSLAFSPDEQLLATKSTSGQIVILDVPRLEIVSSRLGVNEEGSDIHFSPCGEYVIDGSWNGRFAVSRVSNLEITQAWQNSWELVADVCSDQSGTWFLASHKPKTPAGQNFGDTPYLRIWKWPFVSEPRRVSLELDILYGAQISPSADVVAIAGYSRPDQKMYLRILTIDGEACESLEIQDAPYKVRWLRNDVLAVVSRQKYSMYAVPGLRLISELKAPSASDLLMTNDGTELLIGTTKKGYMVPWEHAPS